jgi:site-specific DNA recombinase
VGGARHRPGRGGHWSYATLASILCSPRLAGLREWQGSKYPAQWPAIIDADTHERLAWLLADRPRRAQVTGRKRHLLSGVAQCGKCKHPLYVDTDRYRCASGPGKGCGGVSVRVDMIEEYVTGAVLDVLESARVQQAITAGADTDAPRRAELLAEIRKAQDKRAEARQDWAEDVIGKEDWLDIKQRTDDRIARARKEYDRLTGSATVFGDISPSDAVRDAWQQWNTDRRRAAVKAVLSQVPVSPDTPGRRGTRNRALRVDALRQRT